jgi:hypothetical protein
MSRFPAYIQISQEVMGNSKRRRKIRSAGGGTRPARVCPCEGGARERAKRLKRQKSKTDDSRADKRQAWIRVKDRDKDPSSLFP